MHISNAPPPSEQHRSKRILARLQSKAHQVMPLQRLRSIPTICRNTLGSRMTVVRRLQPHGSVTPVGDHGAGPEPFADAVERCLARGQPLDKFYIYLNTTMPYKEAGAASYQPHEDSHILEHHQREIASMIGSNTQLVELGAGNTNKTLIILQALQQYGPPGNEPISYIGVDIQNPAEEIKWLASCFHGDRVRVAAYHGSFEAAYSKLPRDMRTTYLSFGSEFFNVPPNDSTPPRERYAAFLDNFGPHDQLLISQDAEADRGKIVDPYHHGDFCRFLEDGIFTHPLREEDWEVHCRFGAEPVVHHSYYLKARRHVRLGQHAAEKDDELEFFTSVKLGEGDIRRKCAEIGLVVRKSWHLPGVQRGVYLVERHRDDDSVKSV